MTVDDLIARLEAASGPDRQIDGAILVLLWGEDRRMVDGEIVADDVPFYTDSIDDAMSLADPRALWAIGSMEDGPFARLCWPMPNGGFAGGYQEVKAATVPIAAVIAVLKARAKEGTEDGR